MTGVTSGPVTTIEAYDPEGRIRARTTSVSAIDYLLLDGDGHIAAEFAARAPALDRSKGYRFWGFEAPTRRATLRHEASARGL